MTPRRVYRSDTERLLFGVAGGLAEYFDVTPALARVGFVFLCLVSGGGGILLYLLLAVLMPRGESESPGTPEEADQPGPSNSLLLAIIVVGGLVYCALLILVGLTASSRFFS